MIVYWRLLKMKKQHSVRILHTDSTIIMGYMMHHACCKYNRCVSWSTTADGLWYNSNRMFGNTQGNHSWCNTCHMPLIAHHDIWVYSKYMYAGLVIVDVLYYSVVYQPYINLITLAPALLLLAFIVHHHHD